MHVPFCAHRCGYCDFVTTSAQPELHERYVSALGAELRLRREDGTGPYDTIFVGGGTPTLLEAPARDSLLERLAALAAPGAEVTFECNPETVTPDLARSLVDGGVSRVSLGAQSFQPHVLDVLERRARPVQVEAAIDLLRSAGVGELSLDIIWAVPGQDNADLARDLERVASLRPDHVSAYELELKPGTRLQHRFHSAEEAVGEGADEMYDRVVDALSEAGFEWYETANFAAEGRYCRHNLAYWTQQDYVGIGVGAVGTVRGERRANLPNLPRYLAAVEAGTLPPARIEVLEGDTARQERVMLALRLARPCVLEEADLTSAVDAEAIGRLAGIGLLDELPGRPGTRVVQLTRRGRMLLNSVLGELLR